jgi:periplasmic copper chaperone A
MWQQMRIQRLIVVAVILVSLTACTMVIPEPALQPEPGKVTVVNAMARSSPMVGSNGAAYLTVLNGTETEDRLLSAESPAAGAVELHETVHDNGVMRMAQAENGFELPAGSSLELKPGGKHIMLIGLVNSLVAGETVSLTLRFEHAPPIQLDVPIHEMSGSEMSQH